MGQREKNIVLIGLTILIFGYSYYTFYLNDILLNINEIKNTIQVFNNNANELKKHGDTVEQEIINAKEESKKLDEAIPDVNDKKALVMYFYNLIKSKNLVSDNISFGETENANKKYKTILINLRVSGDYDTVKSFITTIENEKRKFVIKQTTVSKNEKGVTIASLTIECYSLK